VARSRTRMAGSRPSEDDVAQPVHCGDDLCYQLGGHAEVGQHISEMPSDEVDVVVVDAEVAMGVTEIAAAIAVGSPERHAQKCFLVGSQAAYIDAIEERRQLRIIENAAVEGVDGGIDADGAAEPLEQSGGGENGLGCHGASVNESAGVGMSRGYLKVGSDASG
jgi:hypothetical protein